MIDDAQLVQSLLQAGVVDQRTLQEGLRLRGNTSVPLYDFLLRQGLVDEQTLVAHASALLNVPAVNLTHIQLRQDMLDLVPASMATRNQVIPLDLVSEGSERELILGMVDPLDMLAMDEISTHTGIDIRPVLVGPLDLETAIARLYSRKDTDPLSDLSNIAIDVLEDASWAEFFDEAQAMGSLDDSSVISLEMRERPITDVFEVVGDEDSDLPSLDILEFVDLNRPVEQTSLAEWDVDDAITGASGDKEPPTQKRRRPSSEIVSAANAVSLFDEEPATSKHAKLSKRSSVEVEDDLDLNEPTIKKSVEDFESEVDQTGSTRTQRGIKAEGGGRDAGASIRPRTENTDSLDEPGHQTSVGVGIREMTAKRRKDHETDYGALGRKILKTKEKTERDSSTKRDSSTNEKPQKRSATDDKVKMGDTLKGVGEVAPPTVAFAERIPKEPQTREIADVDLAELQAESEDEFGRKPTMQYHAVSRDKPSLKARATSTVQIPQDVDTRAALEALLDLLIDRKVIGKLELQALLDGLRVKA